MKINDYFDKIYCINLDRRTDRWEDICLPQFKKLGLEVERFSAVDGLTLDLPHGHRYNCELAGCHSHLNALQKAKDDGVDKLLLLEDDVVFIENVNERFNEVINNVPTNWEYLFFGGNHIEGFSGVAPGVVKINRSYAIHACGIKKESYDVMIRHLKIKINMVMKDLTIYHQPSVAADYFLGDLHRSLNTYCFLPHLAWQASGHSDINDEYTDYSFLKR